MVKGSRKIWLMKGEGHSGEVGYTQYLSLDKVVTNDSKREFSSSLTFVICYLQNLILINDSQTCLSVSTYLTDSQRTYDCSLQPHNVFLSRLTSWRHEYWASGADHLQ